jgi:hypothetical protein
LQPVELLFCSVRMPNEIPDAGANRPCNYDEKSLTLNEPVPNVATY